MFPRDIVCLRNTSISTLHKADYDDDDDDDDDDNNNNNNNNIYKDPITEIQPMWNVLAKVISVIIGVTGTISKSLRQYLKYTRKAQN